MIDVKLLRENLEEVRNGLAAKRVDIDLDALVALDEKRRALISEVEALKAEKKKRSKEVGRLVKESGKNPQDIIAEINADFEKIDTLDPQLKKVDAELHDLLLEVPNLPHVSVPVGGEEANMEVKTWGVKPNFDFQPKSHVEIAEDLDIIDFKRATKLSGSNFILYKGLGARLERALINYMLDTHTSQHGYREMSPPFMVNTATMTGTGQLPKMKEDMYHVTEDDLYLIPTAEVPVTNVHADEILSEDDLPLYYTAYTPCFRREAGSYGKDTRGLMRVHQFDKVELVKFVKPEGSYDELESLLANAENILQSLNIPYRVLTLASGDLSFAAAKCYDIEVYAGGMDMWLEASSCSNFEDFQARRAGIRFKNKSTGKTELVHTLNGSGVAMPRTMVAILENNQTADGEVIIPEVLRPYMGGLEKIGK